MCLYPYLSSMFYLHILLFLVTNFWLRTKKSRYVVNSWELQHRSWVGISGFLTWLLWHLRQAWGIFPSNYTQIISVKFKNIWDDFVLTETMNHLTALRVRKLANKCLIGICWCLLLSLLFLCWTCYLIYYTNTKKPFLSKKSYKDHKFFRRETKSANKRHEP